MEKMKNWRLRDKGKSIYLPLEPIHLQLDLELNLQKLKQKSPLRYFDHAVFCCPDPMQMIFEGLAASVLFLFLLFNIAYAIYRTCDIYRICDIVNMKYHICPILLPT